MTNSIELTGHALEKFKEYLDNHINRFMSDSNGVYNHYPSFSRLNLEYQYSFYVTFFDTLGVHAFILPVTNYVDEQIMFSYRFISEPSDVTYELVDAPNYDTREEARIGAIKKMNQLYNQIKRNE